MTDNKDWESECCRCNVKPGEVLPQGKRACHISCGESCNDWSKCVSCEIVGHCKLAIDHLKSLRLKKGCLFKDQLSGEENIYQILNFINGEQKRIQDEGKDNYLKNLKQKNSESECLKEE